MLLLVRAPAVGSDCYKPQECIPLKQRYGKIYIIRFTNIILQLIIWNYYEYNDLGRWCYIYIYSQIWNIENEIILKKYLIQQVPQVIFRQTYFNKYELIYINVWNKIKNPKDNLGGIKLYLTLNTNNVS